MTQVAQIQTGNLPYSMTRDAISVMARGKFKVLPSTSPNFGRVKEALRQPVHDVDLILDLMDISRFIARVTLGAVQVADGEVRWDGKKVHGVLVDRILEHLRLGFDLVPLTAFLGRVMQNPLVAARDELYEWLEAGNAPITPDGFFLAFKKVRGDYLDIHSGSIRNAIGDAPNMPREDVDPDRRNECSTGLHFCSFGYLSEFGAYTSTNRVMVLKIDPADVVAIPNDHNRQKGRTWRYEVVGEIAEEKAATFFQDRPVVDVQPPEKVEVPLKVELSVGGFKVGDTAVALGDSPAYFTAGDSYEVLDVDSENETILVVDDDGDTDWWSIENFESPGTIAEAEEMVGGYKVGDLVVYTNTSETSLDHGASYEVLQVDTNEDSVKVADNEDYDVWLTLGVDFDPKVTGGAVEPEPEDDDTDVPVQKAGTAQAMFTYGDRSYLSAEVLDMVKEHGQRGFNRLTGVPRSTLQGWLAKIAS